MLGLGTVPQAVARATTTRARPRQALGCREPSAPGWMRGMTGARRRDGSVPRHPRVPPALFSSPLVGRRRAPRLEELRAALTLQIPNETGFPSGSSLPPRASRLRGRCLCPPRGCEPTAQPRLGHGSATARACTAARSAPGGTVAVTPGHGGRDRGWGRGRDWGWGWGWGRGQHHRSPAVGDSIADCHVGAGGVCVPPGLEGGTGPLLHPWGPSWPSRSASAPSRTHACARGFHPCSLSPARDRLGSNPRPPGAGHRGLARGRGCPSHAGVAMGRAMASAAGRAPGTPRTGSTHRAAAVHVAARRYGRQAPALLPPPPRPSHRWPGVPRAAPRPPVQELGTVLAAPHPAAMGSARLDARTRGERPPRRGRGQRRAPGCAVWGSWLCRGSVTVTPA